jgi:hypothetical protein
MELSIFFLAYLLGTCTRRLVDGLAAASNKVNQLLANGRWFSPGTPASFTTKTGLHDIAELLLKVALNTKNQKKPNRNLLAYLLGTCTRRLVDGLVYLFNVHVYAYLLNIGKSMFKSGNWAILYF